MAWVNSTEKYLQNHIKFIVLFQIFVEIRICFWNVTVILVWNTHSGSKHFFTGTVGPKCTVQKTGQLACRPLMPPTNHTHCYPVQQLAKLLQGKMLEVHHFLFYFATSLYKMGKRIFSKSICPTYKTIQYQKRWNMESTIFPAIPDVPVICTHCGVLYITH